MKILLRSTYKANQGEESELLVRNAHALRSSGLSFDIPEDDAIWSYVKDFIDQHHHPPEENTIRSHFARERKMEVVDRLDALAVSKPRVRGDYLKLLEAQVEDRRVRIVGDLLREAAQIVDVGLTVKEDGRTGSSEVPHKRSATSSTEDTK